ncbi:MAG: hypothetical protein MJ189_01045 [Coriobacteriales bacterium]|nr:hypothetical protein [Coriobacteriales bacterium]
MNSQVENNTNIDRHELFFPKDVSIFVRMHLWMRGYLDGLLGKAMCSDRKGYITSNYCKILAIKADKRLIAEWEECNGLMFKIRPSLEIARREYYHYQRELESLDELKDTLIDKGNNGYKGDEFVSQHLVTKRKHYRMYSAKKDYFTQRQLICDKSNACLQNMSIMLADYQDAKDITETHDSLIRHDFIRR